MQWFQSVGGYNAIIASRPQTVAVGTRRLACRAAGVERALPLLRQRDEPRDAEQIAHQVTLEWLTNTPATRRSVPLRGRARRGRRRQRGADRGRGLRRRLPDDPHARRARQLPHRALDANSRMAATTRRSRSRMWWPATSAPSGNAAGVLNQRTRGEAGTSTRTSHLVMRHRLGSWRKLPTPAPGPPRTPTASPTTSSCRPGRWPT